MAKYLFTLRDGEQTIVDDQQIAQVSQHKDGSQLFFNSSVHTSEGKLKVRSLIVRDSFDVIVRHLKPKILTT